MIDLTTADSGRAIELETGERLRLTLPTETSSELSWEIVALDESVLILDRADEGSTDGESSEPAPATWIFAAEGAGETALEVVYRRPTDLDLEPRERVLVHVVVIDHLAGPE